MDFVHDQLATGRKFRILTVVDTWSRYVPAIDARYSYRGEDVVQTMERIYAQTGYPKMIRVDQGSEFISRDLELWAYANGVTLASPVRHRERPENSNRQWSRLGSCLFILGHTVSGQREPDWVLVLRNRL